MHLHPVWQRKLVQALREDKSDNQYIFTTHSPSFCQTIIF
ncbi:MAG: AAA family ATPase [Pseudomonadota bacterium]